MKKDVLNWMRGIISGAWGLFLFSNRATFNEEGFTFLLIGVPLLGLPWLLFTLHDRSQANQKTDIQHALGVLFGGAIFTTLYTIPMLFAWIFLRNFLC